MCIFCIRNMLNMLWIDALSNLGENGKSSLLVATPRDSSYLQKKNTEGGEVGKLNSKARL